MNLKNITPKIRTNIGQCGSISDCQAKTVSKRELERLWRTDPDYKLLGELLVAKCELPAIEGIEDFFIVKTEADAEWKKFARKWGFIRDTVKSTHGKPLMELGFYFGYKCARKKFIEMLTRK